MRQFGSMLEPGHHLNSGIGPFLRVNHQTNTGAVAPTQFFDEELAVYEAGINITLVHAPV